MAISLRYAVSPVDLALAREIFAEYGASITTAAGCSLQHQGFDGELASLPGKYAAPRGCIVLAYAELEADPKPMGERGGGHKPFGCIAIRPLPDVGPTVCELKRMYVKPTHRGLGAGRLLCEEVIAWSRNAGYTVMKLDTDCTFAPAIALYKAHGFVECPRYNDDPMEDTLWFAKNL